MLTQEKLFSLEHYARVRPQFRAQVIAHKMNRRLPLGAHATLHFEDALTMQYQVQEMLRLERLFEPELIQDELDVYNPLIPDGHNWKATFMIEYPDENERRRQLAQLIDIESRVWLQVDGCEKVYPIANEDLERKTEEKTSAVHFLRFELSPEMIAAACAGVELRAGIDHENYQATVTIPEAVRKTLVDDLQPLAKN